MSLYGRKFRHLSRITPVSAINLGQVLSILIIAIC